MKKFVFALLAAATALAITPSALASSITITNYVTLPDYGTLVAGSTVGGSLVGLFGTVVPPFTATYTESVYEGGTGAMCPTCLNFVITLKNTAAKGTDFIDSISTSDFGSYAVSEGNVHNSVDKVTSGSDVSGILTFQLGNLNFGKTLDDIVIFTDATKYASGTITFQNSSIAGGAADVPAATPEPSSLILLGTGLFGLAFVAFRKSKSSGLVLHS